MSNENVPSPRELASPSAAGGEATSTTAHGASADAVQPRTPTSIQQSLDAVKDMDDMKVTIRFKSLPSAPILKTKVFKISASQKFEAVVKFLRKRLNCAETDSVFCYVNDIFAPGLDEGIGGLWRCFNVDNQLCVSYSMTPAYG